MLGGESQQGSLSHVSGCSVNAHRIGKRSYLEPIRNTMHRPIEGLSEKIEGEVTIDAETVQKHVENQPNPPHPDYLKYIKGGYRQKSHNSSQRNKKPLTSDSPTV